MARRRITALALAGTLATLALCAAGPAGAARKANGASAAARSPTAYLLAAENRDGGFGASPRQSSATLYSRGWAALGLASAGLNPRGCEPRRPEPAQLHRAAPCDRSRIARAHDPHRRCGRRAGYRFRWPRSHRRAAPRHQRRRVRAAQGRPDHVWRACAPGGRGRRAIEKVTGWLVRQQDRNGSFSYATRGAQADVDDTGAALEAIDASNPAVTRRAVSYIRAEQNRDGGFPSLPGGASNAQSTAWAIQGLIAARVVVSRVRHRGSPSPRPVPDLVDHSQRRRQLCPSPVADPGLGDGRGRDCARGQVAPPRPHRPSASADLEPKQVADRPSSGRGSGHRSPRAGGLS